MAKILIVEDDRDLSEVICFALQTKSHIVHPVYDGPSAAMMLKTAKFDLVILDLMLPGLSGIEVCRQFRASGGKTPVLMLTAKTNIDDKETGLDTGADDYLTKPFDQRELAARVRALLRRPDSITGNILHCMNVELDTISCSVRVDGVEVHLRPKEYTLLEFFMRHQNQTFSSEALLQRVWLDDSAASPDNLKTHIKLLRRTLNPSNDENRPSLIKTVKGRGYLFGP
jgi:DNA-binding response OmpR family regulator